MALPRLLVEVVPSYEDYLVIQREATRDDPIWIAGAECIRPPAKLLKVPDGKGRHSQEYR